MARFPLVCVRFSFLVGLALATSSGVLGQSNHEEETTWEMLPSERIMPRLLADPLDPRTGVLKSLRDSRVEYRLGTNTEVLHWNGKRPILGFRRAAIGIGGGAFMQLLIEHEKSNSLLSLPWGFVEILRFHLEDGDYYYGGYAVGEQRYGEVVARYRLKHSHVSSHLTDGRWDATAQEWVDGKAPRKYSRNDIQLMADFSFPGGWRLYGEIANAYSRKAVFYPLGAWSFRAGGAYRWPGAFFAKPFVAVDVRTFDVDPVANGPLGYRVVGGLRLGEWGSRGIEFMMAHYQGPSWRGMFYNEPANEWQIGFYTDYD